MKITRAISAAIILGMLFLASCYWNPSAQTGSLTLQSPAGALPKGVGSYANATHYRVYLLADGVQIPIGSSSYSYSAISSSMTIKDLSVGPEYTVLVSIGTLDDTGFFDVWYYGKSNEVKIAAGEDTSVSIALTASPFENTALLGQEVTGLVVASGQVYASTTGDVFGPVSPDPADPRANAPSMGLSGHAVNSLSVGLNAAGLPQLWANTSSGIAPYDGEGWDTSFSQGLGQVSVLQSGAFVVGSDRYAFFQRSAGLGGVLISATPGDPSTWSWINVDLSEFLTGKPILDFTMTSNAVYFVTKLGTFRLGKNILDAGASFDPNNPSELFNTYAKFISVPADGGGFIPILSLAVNQGATKVYLGTEKGAYQADLTEGSATGAIADASLAAIPGTSGERISMMSVSPDGNWLAFLSSSNLFLVNLPSGALTEFPFYSGLPSDVPGELSSLAWASDGANMRILVAGRRGVVSTIVYGIPPS